MIGLGHDVIAREIYVKEVGPDPGKPRRCPRRSRIELRASLELISEIVREASCSVIAILHADDPAYIHGRQTRVFAYIVDGSPDELQSAIDITLQRFAEYQSLQGAFGCRTLIEQAKGILVAGYAISADEAFERLRDHFQHNGRKLAAVAAAVVESHRLLLPPATGPALAPASSTPVSVSH